MIRFFRQSERIERYKQVLLQLIEKGVAYKCYETQEELEFKRKNSLYCICKRIVHVKKQIISHHNNLKLCFFNKNCSTQVVNFV
ncbi:hypothetical protein FACS1894113_1990 [Alphaproteobacteria bacterium]|nr:hypothetical protein FACS1894113_1990 [Alphaproteobacteria bacterium]